MELIGGGRASQVFALDERKVLRRSGFDVSGEARLMRHLHEAGFPVPEVFAVDGGDLTMRRLHGRTLVDEVLEGRIGVDEAARLLLGLHDRLHQIDAPEWLPTEVRGIELRGEGTPKVLHLDLHPENVIVTDDDAYLVDWTNAAAGEPPIDLAVSWAILVGIDPAAAGNGAAALADLMDAFVGRTTAEALAIAVDYRLADPNVDAAEADRLRASPLNPDRPPGR